MTHPEYEQKRRECWEEFCNRHGITDQVHVMIITAFFDAFDRAYALGKQTETITQEDVEKAAEKYAEDNFIESIVVEEPWPSAKFAFAQAYKDGANFALGKQEKDTDTVIQGWVCRDQDGYISLFQGEPSRDTCDKDDIPYGFWDDNTDHHIELPITSFPDLTWSDEPQEVEIIIKRKRHVR